MFRRLACWAALAALAPLAACSEPKDKSEQNGVPPPDPVAEQYRKLEKLVVDAKLPELSEQLTELVSDPAGFDLERRNKDGLRLLDLAASRNQPLAAAAIVVAGSNVWAVDKNGDSVMHFAARANAPQAIEELKRFVPNLRKRNKQGLTPSDLAQRLNFFECAVLLQP